MRIRKIIIAGLMLLAGWASAQTTQPTTRPTIGVWYQPVQFHATWKSRGINTLFGFEPNGSTTVDQFLASADASGFGVWLQWSVVRPRDIANPIVRGFLLEPDEPDGIGAATPAQMKAKYQAVRAALAAAGVNKPVWIDCDGNKMPYVPLSLYAGYGDACDVLGEDVYPCNNAVVGGLSAITGRLKILQQAKPGIPTFAVIECGPQNLNEQPWTQANDATGTPLGPKMRGPTPDEESQEVQLAFAAGVSGIIYFPDQIGTGWEGFDGTPADVAARMTIVNAALAKTTVPAIKLPPLPIVATPATTQAVLPATLTINGHTYKAQD